MDDFTENWLRMLEARIAALEGKDNDAEQDERDRSGDEITVWLREEASEWEPDDPDYSSPMAARLIEAANLIDRLRKSPGDENDLTDDRVVLNEEVDKALGARVAAIHAEPESTGDGPHREVARMRQLLRDAGRTGDDMNPFPPIRPHHIEDTGDDKDDSPTQTPSGGSAEVRRQKALDRMLSPITPAMIVKERKT